MIAIHSLTWVFTPPQRLDQTASDIKAETPEANIRSLIIDLNSLESVRKAAAEVNAYEEPIDVRCGSSS